MQSAIMRFTEAYRSLSGGTRFALLAHGLVIAGLFAAQSAIGQVEPDSAWSGTGQKEFDFVDLQHAVALMMDAPIARQESTHQVVTYVRDRVDEFQDLLQEAGQATEGVKAALQHLAAMLRQIASGGASEAESKAILADVRRDLDLKIQYFRSRMGVVGTARGFVRVTVNTLRQGQAVKGLVVYCNPYRWADDARPMHPFPALSSPTSTSMLPGSYRCFASEGQTMKGQTMKPITYRDITVGLDGNDTLIVDITVP